MWIVAPLRMSASPGLSRIETWAWQRVHPVPTRGVRHPLVLHRLRQQDIVFKRRAPALVAAGYEFVALVVNQRQEHAHAISLSECLGVVGADFCPADFFDFLGIILRAFPPVVPLRKIGLAGAPPRHVSVPTGPILVPPGIAPQQQTAHHHIFRTKPVAPRGDEAEEVVRAVELGKARLPKGGMDEAPDRPRLHSRPRDARSPLSSRSCCSRARARTLG